MKISAVIIHINSYSTKLTARFAVDGIHEFINPHEHCPGSELADANAEFISR